MVNRLLYLSECFTSPVSSFLVFFLFLLSHVVNAVVNVSCVFDDEFHMRPILITWHNNHTIILFSTTITKWSKYKKCICIKKNRCVNSCLHAVSKQFSVMSRILFICPFSLFLCVYVWVRERKRRRKNY